MNVSAAPAVAASAERTAPVPGILTFIIAESATETITLERRKETWNSLLATPMTARAILQSALLSTVWRHRCRDSSRPGVVASP